MDYGAFIYLWGVTWLLYIQALYLLFISSEGFKVLKVVDGLVISQQFLSSVSFRMESPHSGLYAV